MPHVRVPRLTNPHIVIRLATDQREIDRANELVCGNYVREGYWKDDEPFRQNPYMHSAARIVIVVEDAGKIIGTASIIRDSPARLPLDKYQRPTLMRFRRSGETITEISALAIDRKCDDQRSLVLFLFKYLYQYAFYHLGVDRFVVAANARHAQFYRRICCFERLYWQGNYDYVNLSQKPEFLTVQLLHAHKVLFEKYEKKANDERNFYRFLLVENDPTLIFPNLRPIRSRTADWLIEFYDRKNQSQTLTSYQIPASSYAILRYGT